MLAAVELAMLVDGVAHHVERCLPSALRADDGAMLASCFDACSHELALFISLQSYKKISLYARPKFLLGADFYDLTTFCLFDHSN